MPYYSGMECWVHDFCVKQVYNASAWEIYDTQVNNILCNTSLSNKYMQENCETQVNNTFWNTILSNKYVQGNCIR